MSKSEQPLLMQNPFLDNQKVWRYVYPRDLSYNGPFETEEQAMTHWLSREQQH